MSIPRGRKATLPLQLAAEAASGSSAILHCVGSAKVNVSYIRLTALRVDQLLGP